MYKDVSVCIQVCGSCFPLQACSNCTKDATKRDLKAVFRLNIQLSNPFSLSSLLLLVSIYQYTLSLLIQPLLWNHCNRSSTTHLLLG